MKYFYTAILVLFFIAPGFSQQTATELRATSKTFLQQGDIDNAIKALERAREQEPGNIDVLKELSYAAFIKKDYGRAREIGKEAVANIQADAQAFQILGLSYKAIAMYKDGEKLYKTALAKFPDDGLLHNEYGEILALDNKADEAIAEWEKGIRVDPSYGSNYYNATLYYVQAKNWLRVAIYGELFVNLESYTKRAETIKAQVLTAWSKLLVPGYIKFLQSAKTTTEFEKEILFVLQHYADIAKEGISLENISAIRSQFIKEWVQEKDKKYPFRLFSHQQQMLSLGFFEAYNQWLFGEPANPGAYEIWKSNHLKEAEGFKTFQQGRVFKIPLDQYYFTR